MNEKLLDQSVNFAASTFVDREQCSKVHKEALLLLLLLFFLAWNQVQKMLLGTKNVLANKKSSPEQKFFSGTKTCYKKYSLEQKIFLQ